MDKLKTRIPCFFYHSIKPSVASSEFDNMVDTGDPPHASVSIFHGIEQLGPKEKISLLQQIWPNLHPESDLEIYKDFFSFLAQERDILDTNKANFSWDTLDAHLKLLPSLREHGGKKQKELLEQFHHDLATNKSSSAQTRRSLELVSRIALTLNIHSASIEVGPSSLSESKIEWPEDRSLVDVVNDNFKKRPASTHRSIPEAFSAASLKDLGIKIKWTNSLAEHLSYDGTFLWIYQHKACLWNYTRTHCVLPRDLLEETIDTLNLLFPTNDTDTDLFLKENKKCYITQQGALGRKIERSLAHYTYWGVRLQHLLSEFDRGPRHVVRAAFWTHGDTLGHLNLWVALFVLLLTVVTIVFGGAQLAYAVKQYELSLQQYKLSLQQYAEEHADVCSRENLPEKLRPLCS